MASITFNRTPAFSSRQASEFKQLREDQLMMDFRIWCQGTPVDCHKVILMGSGSPVFKAMLAANKAEANYHFSPVIMNLVLDYVYTGEVTVPNMHLQATLEVCNYLQLTELMEVCLRQALATVDTTNVISWSKVSERLHIDELTSKCSELLSNSFYEVTKSQEFLQLSFAEATCYMGKLLMDVDDMLDASMHWVSHQPQERVSFMTHFLNMMQLSECSRECLYNCSAKYNHMLKHCPSAQSMLQCAAQCAMKETRSQKKTQKSRSIIVVSEKSGQGRDKKENIVIWEMDHEQKEFVELDKGPQVSIGYSICKVPEGLVLTGGEKHTRCMKFDLPTKRWKKLKDLKFPRAGHQSVFVDGKIYVIGGYRKRRGEEEYVSCMHSLVLDGGKNWKTEPELPVDAVEPAVASIGSNIFLLDPETNKLFIFDTKKRTWKNRADLPGRRCDSVMMLEVKGELVVVARDAEVFTVYNPVTDTWSTKNALPALDHEASAALYYRDNLYLIGGAEESDDDSDSEDENDNENDDNDMEVDVNENDDEAEEHIEKYNFSADIWSVCNDWTIPNKLKSSDELDVVVIDVME